MDGMKMAREVAPTEIPGLRAAYAAEAAAVAKHDGIAQRLKQSKADQVMRERDRAALVARAAAGEAVAGADLRTAEEAILDAAAAEKLFTEALKQAGYEVKEAESQRGKITGAAWHLREAKLKQDYDAAVRAVVTAQAEVERTYQRVAYTPRDVIAEMRALFEAHGAPGPKPAGLV